ncbi:MAG TPA: hypothetical protein VJ723_00470 [Candidatus Angelobacter sp.]|nr:hypothetical protein [Candidatus Angelobacter sp.]
MPKNSSKKYPLIPSVQRGTTRPSPITLMPALPVRLGGPLGTQLYAAIDTSAKTSAVSEYTLQELERGGIRISRRQVQSLGQHTELVTFNILLCDPTFLPWIDLGEVPFVVLQSNVSAEAASRILLGYESCLSRLRIDIDYPRSLLTVHAPTRSRRTDISVSTKFPRAIAEGETLIAMGSYRAAAATIAAGVEEAVTSYLGHDRPTKDWRVFIDDADRALAFGPEMRAQLDAIWRLRNLAVHGPSKIDITKQDAEIALHAAKKIIATASLYQVKQEGTLDRATALAIENWSQACKEYEESLRARASVSASSRRSLQEAAQDVFREWRDLHADTPRMAQRQSLIPSVSDFTKKIRERHDKMTVQNKPRR